MNNFTVRTSCFILCVYYMSVYIKLSLLSYITIYSFMSSYIIRNESGYVPEAHRS